MTVSVSVFSKSDCPHCESAAAWLTARGIPFTTIKVEDYGERQRLYQRLTTTFPDGGVAKSVPQILVRTPDVMVRINGAAELRLSGLESLFHAV